MIHVSLSYCCGSYLLETKKIVLSEGEQMNIYPRKFAYEVLTFAFLGEPF